MSSSPPESNRLFVITHEFFPKRGGIATFTEEMALASQQIGWEVEVWAQHAEEHESGNWPFHVWRLPLKGTHDFSCQLRLAIQLIKRRRDLRRATVFLPEPGPMLTLMLLQRFHAFRPRNLYLTFHGSDVLKFYHNPLIRPMARQLITRARLVSVLTDYTAGLIESMFPEARGKLVKTPGALRSTFPWEHLGERQSRDRIRILTVARIHPRKGQMETLRALKKLPEESRQKIEYWIVGTTSRPNYEKALREEAANCDFPVNFTGGVDDIELQDIYRQSDVFAMTSLDYGKSVEGFGLVYLEASAHGLPVIAHAVGGVSEAVIGGKTGILVPPADEPALTRAIDKLILRPDLRNELGTNGRDWARQNNWRHSATALFGLPQS